MREVKGSGYSKAEGETLYYLHKLILQELIKYEKVPEFRLSPNFERGKVI